MMITLDVNNAPRYYSMAIKSFKCADTRLDLAERLEDLRAPPGNRLESLAGNRAGQWSIRINDQFRVCFVWSDANAEDVEIVDYH